MLDENLDFQQQHPFTKNPFQPSEISTGYDSLKAGFEV